MKHWVGYIHIVILRTLGTGILTLQGRDWALQADRYFDILWYFWNSLISVVKGTVAQDFHLLFFIKSTHLGPGFISLVFFKFGLNCWSYYNLSFTPRCMMQRGVKSCPCILKQRVKSSHCFFSGDIWLPVASCIAESYLTAAKCSGESNLTAVWCSRESNLTAALCSGESNLTAAICSGESI